MAEKSVLGRIADSPAVGRFTDSVTDNITARVSNLGKPKAESASSSDSDSDTENGPGLMDRVKSGAGGGAVKGAIKGAFKALKPGKASKRPHNIIEDVWIGVPVEQCWDEWIKFDEWPGYTKGPLSANVDEDDEGRMIVSWTGKIFWSTRSWKSTVEEQVEYERIRWTSEGSKGVLEGAITFTPVGDNATLVLVVIEYRGKGPVEWIGNRWRTVGRRVRLDLKHFRRHVTLLEASEDTGDEEQPAEEQPEEQPEEQQESTGA